MSKIVSMHTIHFSILPAEQNDVFIGRLVVMSSLEPVTENLEHLCFI